MAEGRFVAYYRVSTAQQGRSGLGLDAQEAAVMAYLNGGNWTLVASFTEIESGKNNARPALAQAMHHCRLTASSLVIAKLDRLSRDAHFLLGLAKADVPFVAVDMPHADRTMVGIMAVIAEGERNAISARTKAALAAAKARGTVLGGWKGGPVVDGKLGAIANRAKAEAFAASVGPMVADMHKAGKSLRQIAGELSRARHQDAAWWGLERIGGAGGAGEIDPGRVIGRAGRTVPLLPSRPSSAAPSRPQCHPEEPQTSPWDFITPRIGHKLTHPDARAWTGAQGSLCQARHRPS